MSKWQTEQAEHGKTKAELEALKNQPAPTTPKPWEDPDFQPQNWGEFANAIAEEAVSKFKATQTQVETARLEAAVQLDEQWGEISAADPTVNRDELISLALEYDAHDLRAAYRIFDRIRTAEESAAARAAKNLDKRAQDPVAPGAGGGAPAATRYSEVRGAKSVYDLVRRKAGAGQ